MVIKVGDFCKIADSELSYYGIKKGDLAYVAGSSNMPVEDDPYMFRVGFIVSKMKGKHVDIESKGFLVDPKRLTRLSDVRQEKLGLIYTEDFSPPEGASNDE